MQIQSSTATGSAYQPYSAKAAVTAGTADFANLLDSTQQAGKNTSLGTQYDFTNMTNAQLLDAAHELGSQGEISTLDESQLVGIASGADYVPISGPGPSVSDYLQDPAKTNFIAYMNERLAWDQSTGMAEAASLDTSLLNDFDRFQTHTNISVSANQQGAGSPTT